MSEPEHTVSYSIVYPHPDDGFRGIVILSGADIKKHMCFILDEAAKQWPVIPNDPEKATLYRPSGLRIRPIKTLVQRTRQWLRDHLEDDPKWVLISDDGGSEDELDDELELQGGQGGIEFWLKGDVIGHVLPRDRDRDCVDVIIVTREIIESLNEDNEGELERAYGKALRDREAGARTTNKALPAPSAGIPSSGDLFPWKGDEDGKLIHAGRPEKNYGPPAALFDPILGLLAYRLSHLDDDRDPPEPRRGYWCESYRFALGAVDCYDKDAEDFREVALKPFVQWLAPDLEERSTWSPCGDVTLGADKGVPYGVIEVRNEVGFGGDASLKAQLSYTRMVTEDKEETERVRKACNCPAVLIGIMGDIIEIGIAVYTDGTYTDCVFSSGRVRLGFGQNAQVLRLARAFKAVKLALADLRKFYERLRQQIVQGQGQGQVQVQPHWYSRPVSTWRPGSTSARRHVLFPKPTPEPSWEGRMPAVTFTHRMSSTGKLFLLASTREERRSGLYVGTMPVTGTEDASRGAAGEEPPSTREEVEVVVKFTEQYNEDAHRLLAAAGLAPALHACVPVCGGVKMVVMERVKGERAEQRCYTHGRYGAYGRWEPVVVPQTVYEDVRRAVELLHGAGWVFGKLNLENILCVTVPVTVPATATGDEAAAATGRVGAMLVNFDWAGRADEAWYPTALHDSGFWAPGVERGRIMRKEHDLYMLEKIKALCGFASA
ncbi:hypothetical protein L226DRAFT_617244 [Lentinus tigrinus ALCF2SS1-7]|uniref:uncharacterized protein n=1 Tax=Lentinus tigrinus ALCF2SS1-7 TaxID=1328758 RepID=UPI0011661BB5|nr:hypothetical protein L226DRAFT_617244 [Lentinus tigrinus ALCF2SS1-7]